MAEWTGLEPATLDVTGRYSNQLNYHSVSPIFLNPSLLREVLEFTETTSFLQLLCHQKKIVGRVQTDHKKYISMKSVEKQHS